MKEETGSRDMVKQIEKSDQLFVEKMMYIAVYSGYCPMFIV